MYKLQKKKKIGKVFTSKFVGTGPSSYEKTIYRTAVSQRLRTAALGRYFVPIKLTFSVDHFTKLTESDYVASNTRMFHK